MPTTLATDFGRSRNYCTPPSVDVEILEPARHCENCGEAVRYDSSAGLLGTWVHIDPDLDGLHYTAPRPFCDYCHADQAGVVVYRQHAWHDAVECSRCGGVVGYAIGD
jgi:hypothetical protein